MLSQCIQEVLDRPPIYFDRTNNYVQSFCRYLLTHLRDLTRQSTQELVYLWAEIYRVRAAADTVIGPRSAQLPALNSLLKSRPFPTTPLVLMYAPSGLLISNTPRIASHIPLYCIFIKQPSPSSTSLTISYAITLPRLSKSILTCKSDTLHSPHE